MTSNWAESSLSDGECVIISYFRLRISPRSGQVGNVTQEVSTVNAFSPRVFFSLLICLDGFFFLFIRFHTMKTGGGGEGNVFLLLFRFMIFSGFQVEVLMCCDGLLFVWPWPRRKVNFDLWQSSDLNANLESTNVKFTFARWRLHLHFIVNFSVIQVDWVFDLKVSSFFDWPDTFRNWLLSRLQSWISVNQLGGRTVLS